VAGLLVLGDAVLHCRPHDWQRFVCFLLAAILASGMKLRLPGILGTMSVSFVFILLCIVETSFPEAAVIGAAAAVVQCFWRAKLRPKASYVLFNMAAIGLACLATSYAFRGPLDRQLHLGQPWLLAAAVGTYFVVNVASLALVIFLVENKPLSEVGRECFFWAFPGYVMGGLLVGVAGWSERTIGWVPSLLVVPAVYLVYRYYWVYLERLAREKRHVEQMAALHLRTIEALALAIEAKDRTYDHLLRVQIYATEVAKELALSESEQEAVRAAALLHDVGKLAVPEHILGKPGRLTGEEFEKMKIHAIVGAEILERVQFPYPVAPIVRSHHECWDGSGYPDGLKGEEIPIGARILAAVDCLDSLAARGQYERGLSLEQSMAQLAADAGAAFDPAVVEVLQQRYQDMEEAVQELLEQAPTSSAGHPALDAKTKMSKGPEELLAGTYKSFFHSIAAARQEAQTLFELSHTLGTSLSLEETLSMLSSRLKEAVPCDAIAIYELKGERLVPAHVRGHNSRLFWSLEIPLGQGLSGWVAESRKPIVNGNPSVESGYLDDPTRFSTLRSALVVPLNGLSGVVGVLALYKAESDAFTRDHLRILLAISSKVGLSMENARKYERAETSAGTDYLTGLPNARALFEHLDHELSRCRRTATPLAVMLCDVDGFKQVNDRFGHLEGNKVLQIFARGLRGACREYDYVARMGGDEFVVIAPGLKPEAAAEKAERLNLLIQDAGRQVCGEDLLSLSVGTAFYSEDGHDAEQLLAEADRRMYEIKQLQHKAQQAAAARRHARAHSATVQ
jgi:diguanylate cyclase (GGDEF)-like protein/putative nucleotidyltransferase with HDIG domain